MKWKVIQHNDRYLVYRKTWHSSEWMGIEKKDIRMILIRDLIWAIEVFADCSTIELAHKLLALKQKIM
ncbi:MAG: hypothetical protein NAG76_03735 [Candidatus Pristimantibacillus lignocellulolyticus]|uniref:Uncharacterized protein n=1 Tax=Candidatus Pristimantibacillus lignocellulolyticus TaxID=2994561 RepID=A0A9J6ZHT5_9BACL|nr:MAG: hypothetical protein NAG76_03735 [Candidatus Pristimantibacillus lignocellulolyticus]